jgi:2-pyrone-4,6-dicarboxylate lactonase
MISGEKKPILSYDPHPESPVWRLPLGSCDTHFHIVGPASRFPLAENRTWTPADAPKEKLFELHRKLGICHGVVVQTVLHGQDTSAAEDAINAAPGRYVGIALVPNEIDDAGIARLSSKGFRGIRLHFMPQLPETNTSSALALADRLSGHGMHLQVQWQGHAVHTVGAALRNSPVPVVVDHMGRLDLSNGIPKDDFLALCRLLDRPNFFVKISGIDRLAPRGDYTPGTRLARLLVSMFPDNCLWGTDWPHFEQDHVPNDSTLAGLLRDVFHGEDDTMKKVLIGNPQNLYRFEDFCPEPWPDHTKKENLARI